MHTVFVVVLHFTTASIAVAPMEQPTGYASRKTCEASIPAVVMRWRELTSAITQMPTPDNASCQPLRLR
jgi:hypothetical protein